MPNDNGAPAVLPNPVKSAGLEPGVQQAADFWNNQRMRVARSRFWQWPRIIAFQNELICGERLPKWNAGTIARLRQYSSGRKFPRGISIACGAAGKEMEFLKQGVVDRFDFFEISTTRIAQGQAYYQKEGLADRVQWHVADGVAHLENGARYDLSFWDSALHHMLDTPRAVHASVASLNPGGAFVMNDFIGPSRFQWNDQQLHYASLVRRGLPDAYLRNPHNPGKRLPTELTRPNLEAFIATDPSEAADSDRILPALKYYLSEPKIWYLGGTIYHLALSDVLANLDPVDDAGLLETLLVLEGALIELGENHFAVCIAFKS